MIGGSGALNPSVPDELTIQLSAWSLDGYEGEVNVVETSADSRLFVSHSGGSVTGEAYPAPARQTLVYAVVRRWPAVMGESLDLDVITTADRKRLRMTMAPAMVFLTQQALYGVIEGSREGAPATPQGQGGPGENPDKWPFDDSAIEVTLAQDIYKTVSGCEEIRVIGRGNDITRYEVERYYAAVLSSSRTSRLAPLNGQYEWKDILDLISGETRPLAYHG
ncbi:MAG TPA: hypothetical protein VM487_13805, partial [Phycisphaerae bacterium]|nr:hypothetical protein [Phycisphaerae bacterium]